MIFAVVCATTLSVFACKPKESDVIRVEQVPKEVASAPVANLPTTTSTDPSLSSLPPGHPAIPNDTPSMNPAPTVGMQAIPGMAEFTAATPAPKWAPPAEWVIQPGDAMRKSTWKTPDAGDGTAEISVNVFQGELGGLLANVNRWRGQVGLSANLTEARLSENVQNITVDGRAAQLVAVDGPDNKSLSGLLVFLPDHVWSIKMAGPTKTVQAQRANFRAFIDSIKWQD